MSRYCDKCGRGIGFWTGADESPCKCKHPNGIDTDGYDDLGRICKDLYYMDMCFNAAKRSLDPDTKVGTVIVTKFGSTTTGYNSPPSGCKDKNIPLTRPEKYLYMEHGERNSIYLSAREGKALDGSTFYVAGIPCVSCLRAIMQVGAVRLVYGPHNAIMCVEEGHLDPYHILLDGHPLIVERFKYDETLFKINAKAKEVVETKQLADVNIEFNIKK